MSVALPLGPNGLQLQTGVAIISAESMPTKLASRDLNKHWVDTLLSTFERHRFRPGQLVVDAADYHATSQKKITNIMELQSALDHAPEKFKLYPVAGRYACPLPVQFLLYISHHSF